MAVRLPSNTDLIRPLFRALRDLGGSGRADEIRERIVQNEQYPQEVTDAVHQGSANMDALSYRLTWARQYLKRFGAIDLSAGNVWYITNAFSDTQPDELDLDAIIANYRAQDRSHKGKPKTDAQPAVPVWRTDLIAMIRAMPWQGFERFTLRLLRESGFENLRHTPLSGDDGIDGTARLPINALVSFNVAFQCKRYSTTRVGAPAIRDFRGSLPRTVEKGIFITCGAFTPAAVREAQDPSKMSIELIDSEKLLDMILNLRLGLKSTDPVVIDEDFYKSFF